MKAISLILKAFVVSCLIVSVSCGNSGFKTVSAAKAKEIIDTEKPLILDVRTTLEFNEGHIPNALLLPSQDLADSLNVIAKYKESPIVVYCHTGNRSLIASRVLIRHGFKNVYNIKGGIREWIYAGNEITK